MSKPTYEELEAMVKQQANTIRMYQIERDNRALAEKRAKEVGTPGGLKSAQTKVYQTNGGKQCDRCKQLERQLEAMQLQRHDDFSKYGNTDYDFGFHMYDSGWNACRHLKSYNITFVDSVREWNVKNSKLTGGE